MGSTKEIWLSEGGRSKYGLKLGVFKDMGGGCSVFAGYGMGYGMVEANIRVHRWILISRVRDVDAAEARFVFC